MNKMKIYDCVLNEVCEYTKQLKKIEKDAKLSLFKELENSTSIDIIMKRIDDVNDAIDIHIKAQKVYYFLIRKKYAYDDFLTEDVLSYISTYIDLMFKASYQELELDKSIHNKKEKLVMNELENNIRAIINRIETSLMKNNSIE